MIAFREFRRNRKGLEFAAAWGPSERSREEQIDLIVIALPLTAISRISKILEQIGSAVADICLTTDFVGFRYRSSQISSVGSNPVVLIEERPLKDWRAAKKVGLRSRHRFPDAHCRRTAARPHRVGDSS